MYGKDGEKMIPPVRIHGRKWDVEEWSMFKEIRDERAFNGILNQIIENIQNGSLKAGDALPAERTMAEIMGVSRPAVREALRALELLGIVKPVPGGGNYITEDLDTWLIEPLSILFKLNNGYLRQNQQFRAALEREAAILAARKCTPLDAAELWVILARLDAAEDEKIRGELDRELHKKIAKIADNPMVYSVLAAADQLTENIVSGTRDYIMKKNNSVREVDDQHHRLVKAIINGDAEQAERCMSEHMDTIERYMEEMQKKSSEILAILKGKINITINNLSIDEAYDVESIIVGRPVKTVKATVLTNEMNAFNTFDNPDVVKPEKFKDFTITENGLNFRIPACSVISFVVE